MNKYMISAGFLGCLLVTASCQGQENQISPERIHEIAWEAARNEFNRKAATGAFDVSDLKVKPLSETAFKAPLAVRRKEGMIWVTYGAPAGPWIVVSMNNAGKVLSVIAKYSNL